MNKKLDAKRVLVLGAHPDDAEFHAGGLLTMHARRGNLVKIISVTNGAAGHHQLPPADLIATRKHEADLVAEQTGFAYEVWDFPDGELQPNLDVRRKIIAEIRSFAPDLVLTHRTCDYHPDHRAVGQAVQDASYMLRVPRIVPDVPALRRDPVVAYMNDLFSRPTPLRPDVVLDVTTLIDEIVSMLDCHRSQVYEWLPYVEGLKEPVPIGQEERRGWLKAWFTPRSTAIANLSRSELCRCLGAERGNQVRYAEAYEISEYACPLDAAARDTLFPGHVGAAEA